MIKVYDYSVSTSNPVAILSNAFDIGYEKRLNEIWIAQFTLPADDPKNTECLAFRYVEIFDGAERVDLFRILPSKFAKNSDGKTRTYQCEHVLSTLLDDIMFQYHQRTGYSITQNISFILAAQTTAKWQIGTVDFIDTIDYKWENENLLSGLFSIPKALSGPHQWTWDTETYPWTLNLIEPPTTATARILSKKNLIDLTEDDDPSYIVTRLYPLGYGEGVNQLTIASVNGGVPYIDADTVATYGVIAAPFIDKAEESAATLLAKAQAYLETIKIPRKTYEVNGADIYSITGETLDRIRDPGIMIAVYDEDIVAFTARIVSVSKVDLTGAPGSIKVQISNKLLDSADTTTSIQSKQFINDAYAQGATNIDSNDYLDNCDNTHPATIKFYIPDECVAVNKCLLTYETSKFRAYETGAASAGAHAHLMFKNIGGTWDDPFETFSKSTNYVSGHNHSVTDEGGTYPTTADGGHAHTFVDYVRPATTYQVRKSATSADFYNVGVLINTLEAQDLWTYQDSTEHTHAMVYGIYEFEFLPTAVVIKVDGTTIPATTLTGNDIDIVPYLSLSGGKVSRGAWHTVEIYPGTTVDNPSGLARITAAIVKQIFVQSRGGGNY